MPITKPDRRRISIDVSEDLYNRLNRVFEWGERNRALTGILEFVVRAMEEKGVEALAVFSRTGKYTDLLKKDSDYGNN